MPTIVTGGGNPQNEENQIPNNQVLQNPDINQDVSMQNEAFTPQNPLPQNHIATPQIVNTTVPVVVFVGPPASGKSMILVRLAKYLRKNGYTLEADRAFLNTPDYHKWCDEFEDKLDTNVALDGTVAFLLVKVYKNHQEVAKLLEAPGEDFYTTDPNKKAENRQVKPYLAAIMASKNPKTYVTLLDLDSELSFRNYPNHRNSYSKRFLDNFYPNIDSKRDRIVLLYNMIDVSGFGSIHGCSNINGARNDAKQHYPDLFNRMKVPALAGFTHLDNFVFKTFCTGIFSKVVNNDGKHYQTYDEATDEYPKELWGEITRRW